MSTEFLTQGVFGNNDCAVVALGNALRWIGISFETEELSNMLHFDGVSGTVGVQLGVVLVSLFDKYVSASRPDQSFVHRYIGKNQSILCIQQEWNHKSHAFFVTKIGSLYYVVNRMNNEIKVYNKRLFRQVKFDRLIYAFALTK